MQGPRELAVAAVRCQREGDESGCNSFIMELESMVSRLRAEQLLREEGFQVVQPSTRPITDEFGTPSSVQLGFTKPL